MKKTAFILSVFFTAIMLSSCASTPISQKYPERWEQTYIGMSLEEFKQVWPEANFIGGGGDYPENWMISERPPLGGSSQIVYFVFQDNVLTQFREMGTGY